MPPESLLSDLGKHEAGNYSQAGEEGVIGRIFEAIGTTNRFCVEFGAWDGLHFSNTARLRIDHGWSGLLLEGDAEKSQAPGVVHALVTAENIEPLFWEHGVPDCFDLLSIDIDGNEYWVWKAIEHFRPRVVVIEYNIFFGIGVRKSMPYDPEHVWDKSLYHGASLGALHQLGREKGYSLVYTESFAPNAFFVLDSELPAGLRDRPLEELATWTWHGPDAEPPPEPGRPWVTV